MRRLRLQVTDRGKPRTDRAFLRKVVRAALVHVAREELSVGLLLTMDAEIAQLHGQFLGDATPTDVISFDLGDAADLVVSVETASRIAKQHGHSWRAEVALYVVHGLLHCAGFDDHNKRDRARMRAAEQAVLTKLQLQVHRVDA